MRARVGRVSLAGVFVSVGLTAAECGGGSGSSKPSATATVPTAVAVLDGTVGPGFTIGLAKDSAPMKALAAGRYTLHVDDQSSIHNFHLVGPGVDVSTAVDFVGQRSFTITLLPGTYRFVCDPHRTLMHGRFVVS